MAVAFGEAVNCVFHPCLRSAFHWQGDARSTFIASHVRGGATAMDTRLGSVGNALQTSNVKHVSSLPLHNQQHSVGLTGQAGTSGVGSATRLSDSAPASTSRPYPSGSGGNRASVATRYAVDDDVTDCREDGGARVMDWREPDAVPLAGAQVERTFVMDAAVGRVVCNSKGCRPIFYPPSACEHRTDTASTTNSLSYRSSVQDLDSQTTMYRAKVSQREADKQGHALPQFPMEFAQFLDQMWMEDEAAEKYFEAAVQQSPYNSRLLTLYAEFSWKKLKDPKRAELLYGRALLESPNSAEALASYALFLWQGE